MVLALAASAACAEASGKPKDPVSVRPSSTTEATPTIGRYASSNPGSVNNYWLDTGHGLVVIDAQRMLTDAHRALEKARGTGKPVIAILITHAHPDHVGGIGVFHEAYPSAPIYASKPADVFMHTDPLGFYKITRAQPGGEDYPKRLTYADHIVAPDALLTIGGTRLETAEFNTAEAGSTTVYYDPTARVLFAGDLVDDHATPAMLEGHTCGWLEALGQLAQRFPDVRRIYPGHGAPGRAGELIDHQTRYLQRFRRLVRATVSPNSAGATKVTAAEQRRVLREMARRYSGYQSVASLSTLPQLNVIAVANELRHENPATRPAACRDT